MKEGHFFVGVVGGVVVLGGGEGGGGGGGGGVGGVFWIKLIRCGIREEEDKSRF